MTTQKLPEIGDIVPDDGIAVFRLSQAASLQSAIQAIAGAIAQAFARRHWKLMIVIGAAPGVEAPSVAMRASMVRQWAEAARGTVATALVCAPQFIDPHKFGVIMAANFGMVANVFVDEGAAREWLMQQK
jgi:hypothetical protein